MTKADLVEQIAAGTGLTRTETEAVVNGFIAVLADALEQGRRVDLRGFGSFSVEARAPRTARNPRTNAPVAVEARHVPVFRPSPSLRGRVDRSRRDV